MSITNIGYFPSLLPPFKGPGGAFGGGSMSDVEGVGTGFSDEGRQRWCVLTILIYMVDVSLLHICAFRAYHGTAPPILTIIYK